MIRPLPFELVEDPVWDDTKQAAATALSEAAAIVPELHPRLLIVPGRIERVIQGFLDSHEADLVVAVGASSDLASLCHDGGPDSRAVVIAAPKPDHPSASPRR